MYTAINVDVFVAAYSGAIGGFINQQRTILRSSAEYARLCQQALAFAEEFDTLYASVAPNILQIANIESATSEYFNGYSPPGGNPSITATNYVESAQNIINILTASDTLVAANVTNPIPPAGGGGGGTLAGDVIGPLLSNSVIALSGTAGVVAMNGSEIQWGQLNAQAKISQEARTADFPAQDFTWAPQGPFAGAVTNLNPGNAIVQIAAPAAGGTDGYFQVNIGPFVEARISSFPGAPTLGAIWLGQAGPSVTNFLIAGDGTSQTTINGPTGGGIFMGIANGVTMTVFADRLGFVGTQAALIQHEPQLLNQAAFDLTIAGQAPFGGAFANPGNIIVAIAPEAFGGLPGYFKVNIGAQVEMQLGSFPSFPQYGTVWLGGVVPTGANYAILSDGQDCFVNGINSSRLAVNGSPRIVVLTNVTQVFTDVRASATGLDINLFRNIGDITGSIFFAHDAAAPIIYQAAPTSDLPTVALSIVSQAPFAGAVTNLDSGKLIFQTAAPVGAGNPGFIETYLGATLASRYRKGSGPGGGVFTVFDSGLAQDSIIAVHQDDDSPYSMRFYNNTFSSSAPIMSYYPTGGGFWEFVLEAAGKAMIFSTGGFGLHRLVLADTQATLTVGTLISSTSTGTPAVNQLYINGTTTPNDAQIKLQANSAGALTAMCFATDNSFVTFDVEYTTGSFIARDASAAMLYKNSASLRIYGNAPLTPGSGYAPTDRWSWDLATGNVTMNGVQLKWGVNVLAPILFQADQTANSVDGQSMVVNAQNSTGTGTRGGSLFLKAGTGTSIQGQIFMYGSVNLSGTDGNPRIFIAGASIFYEATQTPFFYQDDLTTNGGTGHTLTVHAQNETGTTSTGGNLLLASGTGTSADGTVIISPTGSTGTANFIFTHVSTALQLKASAASSSINIVGTGTQVVAIQATGTNSNIYYDATTHNWRTQAGGAVLLLTSNTFTTSMVFALDAACTITQAVSAPLNDAPQLTITAATGGAGGGAGGDLVLGAGQGQDGGADGSILFFNGAGLSAVLGTSQFDFQSQQVVQFDLISSDILIWQISSSGTAGHNFKIEAQSAGSGTFAGGNLLLGGGADHGGAIEGGVRLYIDADPTNKNLLEAGEVIAGKRVLTFLKGTVLTTTQMPANTGDMVGYWANAVTAPTTGVPVGGVIPFAEGGQWKYMDTSGTVVTI